MTDDRLRVGIVGCGGIARLYTAIYADLVDMATVVAVADNREGRADHRADALSEAYRVTAHHARLVAADTRNPDTVGVEYTAPGRGRRDIRRAWHTALRRLREPARRRGCAGGGRAAHAALPALRAHHRGG